MLVSLSQMSAPQHKVEEGEWLLIPDEVGYHKLLVLAPALAAVEDLMVLAV